VTAKYSGCQLPFRREGGATGGTFDDASCEGHEEDVAQGAVAELVNDSLQTQRMQVDRG
jgi:hypothetical protein